MNKIFRIILCVLLVLIPFVAIADEKVVGHMPPLEEELLSDPITLHCGIVITEWQGGKPTAESIKNMNTLCNEALSAFFPFVKHHKLKAERYGAFNWSLSLIPDGECYRCLNDLDYRFAQRAFLNKVWGYTDVYAKYIWIVNKPEWNFYKTVFVHELFHAMSVYYGVWHNHAETNAERCSIDEKYAEAFTEMLGYGR